MSFESNQVTLSKLPRSIKHGRGQRKRHQQPCSNYNLIKNFTKTTELPSDRFNPQHQARKNMGNSGSVDQISPTRPPIKKAYLHLTTKDRFIISQPYKNQHRCSKPAPSKNNSRRYSQTSQKRTRPEPEGGKRGGIYDFIGKGSSGEGPVTVFDTSMNDPKLYIPEFTFGKDYVKNSKMINSNEPMGIVENDDGQVEGSPASGKGKVMERRLQTQQKSERGISDLLSKMKSSKINYNRDLHSQSVIQTRQIPSVQSSKRQLLYLPIVNSNQDLDQFNRRQPSVGPFRKTQDYFTHSNSKFNESLLTAPSQSTIDHSQYSKPKRNGMNSSHYGRMKISSTSCGKRRNINSLKIDLSQKIKKVQRKMKVKNFDQTFAHEKQKSRQQQSVEVNVDDKEIENIYNLMQERSVPERINLGQVLRVLDSGKTSPRRDPVPPQVPPLYSMPKDQVVEGSKGIDHMVQYDSKPALGSTTTQETGGQKEFVLATSDQSLFDMKPTLASKAAMATQNLILASNQESYSNISQYHNIADIPIEENAYNDHTNGPSFIPQVKLDHINSELSRQRSQQAVVKATQRLSNGGKLDFNSVQSNYISMQASSRLGGKSSVRQMQSHDLAADMRSSGAGMASRAGGQGSQGFQGSQAQGLGSKKISQKSSIIPSTIISANRGRSDVTSELPQTIVKHSSHISEGENIVQLNADISKMEEELKYELQSNKLIDQMPAFDSKAFQDKIIDCKKFRKRLKETRIREKKEQERAARLLKQQQRERQQQLGLGYTIQASAQKDLTNDEDELAQVETEALYSSIDQLSDTMRIAIMQEGPPHSHIFTKQKVKDKIFIRRHRKDGKTDKDIDRQKEKIYRQQRKTELQLAQEHRERANSTDGNTARSTWRQDDKTESSRSLNADLLSHSEQATISESDGEEQDPPMDPLTTADLDKFVTENKRSQFQTLSPRYRDHESGMELRMKKKRQLNRFRSKKGMVKHLIQREIGLEKIREVPNDDTRKNTAYPMKKRPQPNSKSPKASPKSPKKSQRQHQKTKPSQQKIELHAYKKFDKKGFIRGEIIFFMIKGEDEIKERVDQLLTSCLDSQYTGYLDDIDSINIIKKYIEKKQQNGSHLDKETRKVIAKTFILTTQRIYETSSKYASKAVKKKKGGGRGSAKGSVRGGVSRKVSQTVSPRQQYAKMKHIRNQRNFTILNV